MNRPDSIREEPSLAELMEARERADAGIRLAMPQLAERIGISDPEPEVPADPGPIFAIKVIDHLREARIEFREALMDADRMGDWALHMELAKRTADLDDFLEVLGERWSL